MHSTECIKTISQTYLLYFNVCRMSIHEYSKETLQAFIQVKTRNATSGLLKLTRCIEEQYFDKTVCELGKHETFVDMGVFDAETSIEFAKNVEFEYDKILLFEPDVECFKVSKENIEKHNLKNVFMFEEGCYDYCGEISFVNEGTSSSRVSDNDINTTTIKIVSLDDKLEALKEVDNITYIKMDIEGSEYEALKGSIRTIKKYKPRLAVSIYHKPEDIYKLPLFIKEILPEYKLYIRHYNKPEPLDVSLRCELVCYAVI